VTEAKSPSQAQWATRDGPNPSPTVRTVAPRSFFAGPAACKRLRILQEHPRPQRCDLKKSARSPIFARQLTIRSMQKANTATRRLLWVGRILYEYDQGGWNEWHVMMNDGTSAWLSDAQNEYAVSSSGKGPESSRRFTSSSRPAFNMEQPAVYVSRYYAGHYRGVEGELPFQYGI